MTETHAKRRRGCFYYGCLFAAAVLAATLAAPFLGLWYLKRTLNEFTDTQPVPVAVAQVSEAQARELEQRIDAFAQAIHDHRPVAPLVLSAQDINAMIAASPRLDAFRGKLYLIIEANRLKGQVSAPLSEAGLKMLEGRYLNGLATFGFALTNGVLGLWVDDFQVRGRSLPRLFMNRIRKQNLAQRLKRDPQEATALDRLQNLQIKHGQLVIVPVGE
jgi:hypothetical protein